MVRVPSEVVVVPVPMFPEPDHAPELHAQTAYEQKRDGDVWAGIMEDPLSQSARESAGSQAAGPQPVTDVHHGPRTCNQPSHAEWFIARHPEYRSRDDAHT